jgi:hypothetical protein
MLITAPGEKLKFIYVLKEHDNLLINSLLPFPLEKLSCFFLNIPAPVTSTCKLRLSTQERTWDLNRVELEPLKNKLLCNNALRKLFMINMILFQPHLRCLTGPGTLPKKNLMNFFVC